MREKRQCRRSCQKIIFCVREPWSNAFIPNPCGYIAFLLLEISRQLVLFRVLGWADSDSLFLWERARLHLGTRILAMATYHRCDPCWCSPPPPRYLNLTCTGFAQPLARMTDKPLTSNNLQNTDSNFTLLVATGSRKKWRLFRKSSSRGAEVRFVI
uniref:Uncharacterized protein n=1 Tax=Felis catus TaxID=9685 RepID=A0ABI7WDP3_FELCA